MTPAVGDLFHIQHLGVFNVVRAVKYGLHDQFISLRLSPIDDAGRVTFNQVARVDSEFITIEYNANDFTPVADAAIRRAHARWRQRCDQETIRNNQDVRTARGD